MIQELIVLRGPSNSGKSSTLKHLANMFFEFDTMFSFAGNDKERKRLSAQLSEEENWFVRGSQSVTDINGAIFTCSDVKIGITSLGDDFDKIEKRLNRFNEAGCTVCICALHPTVKMDEKIQAFREKGGCAVITSVYKQSLNTASSERQRLADQLTACELFGKVTEAIRRNIQ